MNSIAKVGRTQLAAILLAILVLPAACGTSDEQTSGSRPGMMDGGKALAEYRTEKGKLLPDLPSGTTWKEVHPYASPNSEYQVGHGANLADSQWECLWVKEYLKRQGQSESATQAALKMLNRIPRLPEWSAIDQGGKEHYNANMGKARLGDPSGFQDFSRANCAS